ncbi:CD225/dispanin family protein [Corynebacterium hindlerae]|uniref:CD225/dispanin family protein n=1 Tax=Corynebacterium hindlerae TaxID=699041 RepID=UPI0031B6D12F
MTTPQNPFEDHNSGNEYGQENNNPYGQTPGDAYSAAGSYPTSGYSDQPLMEERPQNYLVWAILTTVLCCTPLGIVSIVYASRVNGKWDQGDRQGAVASAEKAKLWAIIAAVLGIVGLVLSIVVEFVIPGMEAV